MDLVIYKKPEKPFREKIISNIGFFSSALIFAIFVFFISRNFVVKEMAMNSQGVEGVSTLGSSKSATKSSTISENISIAQNTAEPIIDMNNAFEYTSSSNSSVSQSSQTSVVTSTKSTTSTIATTTAIDKATIKENYIDKRVDVLREYYKNLGSPLADTQVPELYVKYADEYNFNKWSLFAAISTIESADCKYKPAFNKFNCWGYGGGGTGGWPNWEVPIKAMAKQFSKTNSNPQVFITWYCPPCKNPNHPEYSIANHDWDNIVIREMQKINLIAKKMEVPEVDPYAAN